MSEQNSNRVYISMMLDSLRRKKKILLDVQKATREQEEMLHTGEMDDARFQELIRDKGAGIEELEKLDEGFDVLFRRLKEELVAHRENYKAEIQEMQQLITDVSGLGVSIQALEHQNSEHFKVYLAEQRDEIRKFHVNQKTASSYYKNMANVHRSEQSYFFNETK